MGTNGLKESTRDVHPDPLTIRELLAAQMRQRPGAVALAAPGRRPLTYQALWDHLEGVRAQLVRFGIAPEARVAMVLPNGPEMATAFLAAATLATAAPLNPAYRADEFDFYLADLKAAALIVTPELSVPAATVARTHNIPVIELTVGVRTEAGRFALTLPANASPTTGRAPEVPAADVALVLHTSGTTSRPKIVPLTHGNLCASSANVRRSLQLTCEDRCLNVMPLFHVHGLVASLLASLSAGASVVCTPGFIATQFFDWLREERPTWYTAVPTMHQAIVARASADRPVTAAASLRLARSASAALPPVVAEQLALVLGVPVVEAYGMTEAAHQICSNPLPPQPQKYGSVGLPTGTEVAIMGDDTRVLPRGQAGQVVLRGANVTRGYDNNPDANAAAYVDDWFRTGDQGFLDTDGYLFLTGRIKEIINRGGEKIMPREVDEVLLQHGSVAQAVTFAVPDARLGEDVAVAVVLKAGTRATTGELQRFAAERLADFKVPRQIVQVTEIPRGPTGKLQRIGLAEKLGLTRVAAGPARAEYRAPRTVTEAAVAAVWSQVLRVERVGIDDPFCDLGGDSSLATLVLSRLRRDMNVELPVLVFVEAPTVAGMAEAIEARQSKTTVEETARPALPPSAHQAEARPVLLHATPGRRPFFWFHRDFVQDGGGPWFDMARYLAPDQPIYVIPPHELNGPAVFQTIEAMATDRLALVRAQQPEGPYLLGGFCSGALIAFEIAHRLRAHGEAVDLLLLLAADARRTLFRSEQVPFGGAPIFDAAEYQSLYPPDNGVAPCDRVAMTTANHEDPLRGLYARAFAAYFIRPYPGRITLFQPAQDVEGLADPMMGWRRLAEEVDYQHMAGDHLTCCRKNAPLLAQQMQKQLHDAQAGQVSEPL